MIERALANDMTPLSSTIDAFATRITAAITKLRRDVDQLKFTEMSMIFGTMEITEMLIDSEVPPATTRDEEKLGVDKKSSYERLTEVEEAMIDSALQISLRDTTMDGSSVTDTPGMNA
ncbi:hypothetical protein H5410_056914 [Solanum commersonii]|uniref:Polyprotein protein n=1 Tax=Solanum commersonii TaxID=4109 RepID=A0A9J5WNM5_SOLCO|nr:hypothetical protein H5410_056914 [Solanum commersonii]